MLDRGWVWALAHPRGGGELGRSWYLDGKLLNKRNTFTDTIACARHLETRGHARRRGAAIFGGSAGGLLVGACLNIAPQQFGAAVAAVPFVDVVSTMSDPSLPLTVTEWEEWGDPRTEPWASYMLSYSPYDNIGAHDYPAMLVTPGLWDSQVQYWEPAKYVARLRERKTDHNPLLMHVNFAAGHGGASGRFERLKERAREYAFFIDLAGQRE